MVGRGRVGRSEQPRCAGRPLALLALCGVALEAVWLLGFLWPFNLWQHHTVVTNPNVLAVVLGASPAGALRFAASVLAGFVVLGLALGPARRLQGRAAVLLVLCFCALFSVTLVPANPVTADDVYHDVADARTLFVHHANPSLVAPAAFKHDPFLKNVPAWRDTPSAYGPLWYLLSGVPLRFTGARLWANVIAQKLIVSAFMLATVALVIAAAARLRPNSAVAAGVFFGWCPLVLWESAGAGHNDIVMVFFAIAALYAALRGWWLFVFPLLALSVATKPTLAVLAPALLVWMLSKRRASRADIAASLIVGAATAAVLYLPFFSGFSALAGLGREAGHVSSSPGALIHTTIAIELHVNGTHLLNEMKLVGWPLFAVSYGVLLDRLRRRPAPDRLTATAFAAVMLLLLLVTWWFMPWYVLWLLPLAAIRPGTRSAALGLSFALGAMLLYVPHFWLLNQNAILQEAAAAATAFLPPLLVALWPGRAGNGRGTRPLTVGRTERLALP